jgi:hypothetical protein
MVLHVFESTVQNDLLNTEPPTQKHEPELAAEMKKAALEEHEMLKISPLAQEAEDALTSAVSSAKLLRPRLAHALQSEATLTRALVRAQRKAKHLLAAGASDFSADSRTATSLAASRAADRQAIRLRRRAIAWARASQQAAARGSAAEEEGEFLLRESRRLDAAAARAPPAPVGPPANGAKGASSPPAAEVAAGRARAMEAAALGEARRLADAAGLRLAAAKAGFGAALADRRAAAAAREAAARGFASASRAAGGFPPAARQTLSFVMRLTIV